MSRCDSGEPWFGTSGASRFDDPLHQYGTCYTAESVGCAFAETVLHGANPNQYGMFDVPREELEDRFVIEFDGADLEVADFTGTELLPFGLDNDISSTKDYSKTQAWSQVIHGHRQTLDGIVYYSRILNNKQALVIFERASPKIWMTRATRFLAHADSAKALLDCRVISAPKAGNGFNQRRP